ncbi:MAG: hypothetical protein HOI95_19340 [Chromatiales bacterium]|jgi:hypothetical protein|nr:hypothetical protein [Chromatiales bacterium]
MQLIDPTVDTAARDFSKAPLFSSLEGLTVGLLTNGKVNADTLLSETAALFKQHHGCNVAEMFSKSNASAPAPPDTLKELAEQCDFMMTASGD